MRAALELAPEDGAALNQLCSALIKLGRYDEVLHSAERATALAYNNKGVALQAPGRVKEAEASYRRAVALKPDYVQAPGNLAALIQEPGRAEEAEEMYRRVGDFLLIMGEVARLHLGHAPETPGAADHLPEEEVFKLAPGLELAHELPFETFEIGPAFARQDLFLGHQSMAQGIEANGFFSLAAFRSGAHSGVSAVG